MSKPHITAAQFAAMTRARQARECAENSKDPRIAQAWRDVAAGWECVAGEGRPVSHEMLRHSLATLTRDVDKAIAEVQRAPLPAPKPTPPPAPKPANVYASNARVLQKALRESVTIEF